MAFKALDSHLAAVEDLLHGVNPAEVEAIAAMLRARQRKRGIVYVAGNGGSAANASHMACHLADVGITAICLTDNVPLLTARANDTSYERALSECVPWACTTYQDMVLVFSCSGSSPNILDLLARAHIRGIPTAGLFGFKSNEPKAASWCDASVVLDSENYGAVEDIHSVLIHCLKQMLLR